jgi:hypothetical protein
MGRERWPPAGLEQHPKKKLRARTQPEEQMEEMGGQKLLGRVENKICKLLLLLLLGPGGRFFLANGNDGPKKVKAAEESEWPGEDGRSPAFACFPIRS